jgi:DeoR/GlpR family transcriptional regulator of sugar metabolism
MRDFERSSVYNSCMSRISPDETPDAPAATDPQIGAKRRRDILRYLQEHGSGSIAALCELMKVSPATIHRDLQVLADEGLINRVRGGALSLQTMDDPHILQERDKRLPEKLSIVNTALAVIGAGDNSIFLEASTTVRQLVPNLIGLRDKVFVTNSPEIALDLVAGSNEVVVVGGSLRSRTLSSIGQLAIAALEAVHIDLAFVGVSSIDTSGMSCMNFMEAETKTAIIQNSRKVVALCDGTKLGRRMLAAIGPVSAIDELITNADAPEEEVQKLRAAGLKVTLAES